MASTCRPKKDFLRHIAMPSIAEALVKLDLGQAPQIKGKNAHEVRQLRARIAGLLGEIKRRLASAEVSYNFSAYGGQPEKLASYLGGPEWDEVVRGVLAELRDDQEALEFLTGVLRGMLSSVVDSYRDSCPPVYEAAQRALSRLSELEKSQTGKAKPSESDGGQGSKPETAGGEGPGAH